MTIICQKLIPSKSKYSESRLINTIYHIIIIQLKQKCNNIHNEKKTRPAVQAIFTDTETFFNCSGQLSAGCSSNHFPPLSEARLELDPGLSCVW